MKQGTVRQVPQEGLLAEQKTYLTNPGLVGSMTILSQWSQSSDGDFEAVEVVSHTGQMMCGFGHLVDLARGLTQMHGCKVRALGISAIIEAWGD